MSVSPEIHSVPNMKSQMTPTVDSEREEFRKYLEPSGVLDVITRIFQEMYEKKEKIADPLAYFISALGAVNYETTEVIALESEVEGLKSTIEELKSTIEDLGKENSYLRSKLNEASSD